MASGVPRLPEDLSPQDGVAKEIWFVPAGDGVDPHYSFSYDGTREKEYLHLWIGGAYPEVTWGWVLHESAILLWKTGQ